MTRDAKRSQCTIGPLCNLGYNDPIEGVMERIGMRGGCPLLMDFCVARLTIGGGLEIRNLQLVLSLPETTSYGAEEHNVNANSFLAKQDSPFSRSGLPHYASRLTFARPTLRPEVCCIR